jgi:hypothetical protein
MGHLTQCYEQDIYGAYTQLEEQAQKYLSFEIPLLA